MGKYLPYIVFGLLTLTTSFAINDNFIRPKKLERELAIVADTNKDNATMPDEWAKVYKEFGIRYDVHTANPRGDLTIKQMEEYIAKHK